jgi:hypothetical protein
MVYLCSGLNTLWLRKTNGDVIVQFILSSLMLAFHQQLNFGQVQERAARLCQKRPHPQRAVTELQTMQRHPMKWTARSNAQESCP